MATENVEDVRFQEILELEGIGLEEFYQQAPTENLFPDAQTYPEFFNDNLVSPNRIIKEFLNNAQSNIRIFYFQLFRLGFEIESETNNNRNFIVNLRRIIFHPEFEILFTQETEDQRNLYNDFQFKRLFAQFIVLLERQEFPNVQQIISHYPIMDTIFIHLFRSLLANQNINEQFDATIPSEVVFGELSAMLSLTITSYGNCWKFEDSDMFCFEDGEAQLYLAYIVDDGGAQESQEQIEQQQYISGAPAYNNGYQTENIHPDAVHTDSNIIQSNNYSNNYQAPYEQQNQNTYERFEAQPQPVEHVQTTVTNTNQGYYQVENNVQPAPAYNNPIKEKTTERYSQEDSALNYKASDYFSNQSEVNRSQNRTEFVSNYKPQYKAEYKPYESPYASTYNNNNANNNNANNYTNVNTTSNYNNNSYSNNTNTYGNNNYNNTANTFSNNNTNSYNNTSSYGYNNTSSNTYESNKYKPVEVIPSTVYQGNNNNYVSTFKPVEPTPMPTFENFKSSYEVKKQYTKPATSYERYNDIRPTQPSSSYTSNVFDSKTYSNTYKPLSSIPTEGGDYFKDFTPPEILSKLRTDNRDNINKIRDAMKGVTRGGQLPPDFDLRKSAIYGNSSSSTVLKQDIYRNQSRSQLQYPEVNKTSLANQYNQNNQYNQYKPLNTDTYSNKPYSSYSHQQSYNSYNSYNNLY